MESNEIDLSKQRRLYFSKDCGLDVCPECGKKLVEEYTSILLCAKTKSDYGEIMTSANGSKFCKECPIVVFDNKKLEEAVTLGFTNEKEFEYSIKGIIDYNKIPKEKKHLQLGTDKNPLPLVYFLKDLNSKTVSSDKKQGRNDPCECGSGLKYKKCCGKV